MSVIPTFGYVRMWKGCVLYAHPFTNQSGTHLMRIRSGNNLVSMDKPAISSTEVNSLSYLTSGVVILHRCILDLGFNTSPFKVGCKV